MLIVLALIFLVSACRNTPCSKVKPYTDKVAVGLAAVLDCTNVPQMQADIIKYCEDTGKCKADLNGPIAMVVCPIVVPYLMQYAVGQLPPVWGCTGKPVEGVLITACNAIPF
jgi:hypothetical protein